LLRSAPDDAPVHISRTSEHVKNARDVMHDAAPWVERLARLGYAARGVVYLIAGGATLRAAVRPGGQAADPEAALGMIASRPFGSVALAVVAVGLFGYALWAAAVAVLDSDRLGTSLDGWLDRAGWGISAVFHALLAAGALQLLRGHGGGQGDAAQQWSGRVLALPGGRWLLGAVGVGMVAAAVVQVYRAYRVRLGEHVHPGHAVKKDGRWLVPLGRVGIAAQGLVLGIVGWFVVHAALRHASSTARDMGGALQSLDDGGVSWMLGILAAGLIAFGAFQLLLVRYRRIRAL
jgi:hypothetical protein